ncbi:hypothetical protein COLO4_33592 [Corchorus olitorius]|uniref:Uncharacterized protein n=1 Tax=Corchorus olitorius TaxID=93759 RepID=A0A1R3GSL9_9ROSI|nr:hypothetical protein COLO4_33592 [Corchorus olitorius]
MAREFVVLGGNGPGEEVAGFVTRGGSGGLLLLCMIVFSISIISMVVFACGDDGNSVRGKWNRTAETKSLRCGRTGRLSTNLAPPYL